MRGKGSAGDGASYSTREQARAALEALRCAEYRTVAVEAKLRLLRVLGEVCRAAPPEPSHV